MEKLKNRLGIFFAFIALMLAFAFKPAYETLYVQTSPGIFQTETAAGGSCIVEQSEVCKYTLRPDSDPQDPNSYDPAPGYTNQMWVP
ncbi:MAG: hypothetical protein Q8S11_01945 [Daejeonella sp.]|uniref:hypothetical protein n=1 Tax=Daejeonella sp. TaxID=2805397 RepID=UPI0027351838|nr:hypothetical protein [Daejeonella sp.]MDP3467065.1 hypothetical protein [Daejeonella sp.]